MCKIENNRFRALVRSNVRAGRGTMWLFVTLFHKKKKIDSLLQPFDTKCLIEEHEWICICTFQALHSVIPLNKAVFTDTSRMSFTTLEIQTSYLKMKVYRKAWVLKEQTIKTGLAASESWILVDHQHLSDICTCPKYLNLISYFASKLLKLSFLSDYKCIINLPKQWQVNFLSSDWSGELTNCLKNISNISSNRKVKGIRINDINAMQNEISLMQT